MEPFTEIEVSDDIPEEDEEDDHDLEETESDIFDENAVTSDAIDSSLCCFSEHTAEVYCSALNPFIPGLVITGCTILFCKVDLILLR
jgi:hypothetical protein